MLHHKINFPIIRATCVHRTSTTKQFKINDILQFMSKIGGWGIGVQDILESKIHYIILIVALQQSLAINRSSPLSEIRHLETLVINRYIKQVGSDVSIASHLWLVKKFVRDESCAVVYLKYAFGIGKTRTI